MDRDAILTALAAIDWTWPERDRAATKLLRDRIETRARRQSLIHYSDLVDSVEFNIPSVNGGKPYYIDTTEWTGLDRSLVGQFLGFLSAESFRQDGFMISALVIGKSESQPSDYFFDWMKELGVLANVKEDTVLKFWADQVRTALAHYQR